MEFGSLAEWFAGLAEWFGALAGCLAATATLSAVVVALFSEPLKEVLKRFVQRSGGVEIVGISQIEQTPTPARQLKTRFRIWNKMPLDDVFKVYVTEIVGRTDFIAVPLVWMHGLAKGEEPTTIKEIGAKEHGWVDFLRVEELHYSWGEKTTRLLLDVGIGEGVTQLESLHEGKTELVLQIDPHHGKAAWYHVTVEWDGTSSHPKISYATMRR